MDLRLTNRTRLSVLLSLVGTLVIWGFGAWIAPEMARAQSSGASSSSTGGDTEARSDPGELMLHEYIDPADLQISSSNDRGSTSSADGAEAPNNAEQASRSSRPPSQTGSRSGAPPELTLNSGPGDLVRGPSGPLDGEVKESPYGPTSGRSGVTPLDRKTDRVSDLEYNASFDPSVFPYKRKAAQNRAVRTDDGQYHMSLESRSLERLSVGGAEGPNEDTFWGTFLLRAEAGRLHPIPTPAPRTRFLDIQTEPVSDVTVLRDRADNYYLRVEEHTGRLRVNARVASPGDYFNGTFEGSDVTWNQWSDSINPGLSPEIERAADRVLSEIGVSRDQSPAEVMNRLIYYFRNFEAKSLPADLEVDDLYETIALRQIGVCRHRSLAFVITAQALGIPTRYVYNEAHAFVEVRWPQRGWRRIDLGGIARDIGYNGSQRDRLHEAGNRDSFPRPPAYREEMEEMRQRQDNNTSQSSDRSGDGSNAPDESSEADSSEEGERRMNMDRSPREAEGEKASQNRRDDRRPSRRVNRGEDSNTNAANRASEQASSSGRRPGESGTGEGESRGSDEIDLEAVMQQRNDASSGDADTASEQGRTRKPPTRIGLRASRQSVLRGSPLQVSGVLTTSGDDPIADQNIRLYLGRIGSRSTEAMSEIKTVETDRSGRFEAEVAIPETTDIGRWSLIAVFEGSDRYAGSRSD